MIAKERIEKAIFAIAAAAAVVCTAPLTSTAQAEAPQEARTATVRIVPVHVNGKDLGGDVKVDLFREESGKTNLASEFHGGTATGIRYGTYRVRVYVRGFWEADRVVRVFQPDVLAVIGLQVGTEGGPQEAVLAGHLEGANPSMGPIRVRIAGVYSSDVFDAEGNGTGEFSVAGVPVGDYVLVATQKEEILAIKAIRLPLKESPVVIHVSHVSNNDAIHK